jgi:hypothetical protein
VAPGICNDIDSSRRWIPIGADKFLVFNPCGLDPDRLLELGEPDLRRANQAAWRTAGPNTVLIIQRICIRSKGPPQ